jgi:hypothetical protein
MPDTVIARVNALGTDQPKQLIFTDRRGRPIGDVDIPGVMDFAEEDDDDAVMPVLDPVGIDGVELPRVDVAGQAPQTIEIDVLDIPQPDPPLIETFEEPTAPQMEQDKPTQVAQLMQTAGLRRSTRVKIQPNLYEPTMTGSKYSYAITQLETRGVLHRDPDMFVKEDFYQSDPDVVAHIMTQLSLKNGFLKQWGNKAYAAVTSEMKQLHFRNTFRPKHWSELSKTQRQTVLESHMFLKEKRDGSLKERTVAGGNKQRDYISKEDASLPTVATEAVLLSCIINAEEGRDVAVIDIPNAFIQTRVEDEGDMAIKIRGVLVDILVQIAPDVYKSYVTTDKKGTKQLLVQCQNALYGTMVASLLYYRKFTKSLTSFGFEINPYDPCVANKIVDGTQMTICFHVDDCKLSHRSSRANDNMIDWLRQEYESIFEDGSGRMTVSSRRVHKYLGMTLDYTVHGQVNISMFDYVNQIINAFYKAKPKGGGTKSSAAPDDLFKVDEDCEKLPA